MLQACITHTKHLEAKVNRTPLLDKSEFQKSHCQQVGHVSILNNIMVMWTIYSYQHLLQASPSYVGKQHTWSIYEHMGYLLTTLYTVIKYGLLENQSFNLMIFNTSMM